jgi:hypothetical protein
MEMHANSNEIAILVFFMFTLPLNIFGFSRIHSAQQRIHAKYCENTKKAQIVAFITLRLSIALTR